MDIVYKILPSLRTLKSSSIIALECPNIPSPEAEGSAIILSEALLFNWVVRNDKVFNRNILTPIAREKLYQGRLRARIKADFKRLYEGTFDALWLQKNFLFKIIKTNRNINILFPP
jgi:hypothetical protein